MELPPISPIADIHSSHKAACQQEQCHDRRLKLHLRCLFSISAAVRIIVVHTPFEMVHERNLAEEHRRILGGKDLANQLLFLLSLCTVHLSENEFNFDCHAGDV